MGLDILLSIAWFLGAAVIIIVLLSLLIKRRFLAAGIAALVTLAANAPFFAEFRLHTFTLLQAEFALALACSVPALVYARRWLALAIYLPVILLPITVLTLTALRIDVGSVGENSLLAPLAAGSVAIMWAPTFLVLASVFVVGAFIERRPCRSSYTG
jgi:hypothetical protein